MKILWIRTTLMSPRHGADRSHLERLVELQKRGISVAIHSAVYGTTQSFKNVRQESFSIPSSYVASPEFDSLAHDSEGAVNKYLMEYLEKENPDQVWVLLDDPFAMTSAAKWNGSRTYVYVSHLEYVSPQKLLAMPKVKSLGEAMANISHVIVASPYMSRKAKKDFPKAKMHPLPPPLHSAPPKVLRNPNGRWLFVNPRKQKGLEFALELARALPSERFLFVRNWVKQEKFDVPANVEVRDRTDDMQSLWSETRALLIPSVWREGLGRVALEAMAAGVPVVASSAGALPETILGGGIVLPLALPLWTSVLTDMKEKVWLEFIDRGFSRLSEYKIEMNRAYDQFMVEVTQEAREQSVDLDLLEPKQP